MKILLSTLLLLSLFSLSSHAQNNPDGDGPSIHITPILYFDVLQADAAAILAHTSQPGDKEIFAFSVLIKIPANDSFTFGISFERIPRFLGNITSDANKLGATISFYFH